MGCFSPPSAKDFLGGPGSELVRGLKVETKRRASTPLNTPPALHGIVAQQFQVVDNEVESTTTWSLDYKGSLIEVTMEHSPASAYQEYLWGFQILRNLAKSSTETVEAFEKHLGHTVARGYWDLDRDLVL